MKSFLLFFLLVLVGCDCEKSSYYQIKSVVPDASLSWKCHYMAQGMSTCATWQKSPQIVFADSCGKFVLSEVVSQTRLSKYR
ncbi:MAG: hypothetical protein JSS93_03320 [Bacteroidetes bacterium]|nr:hypothetical protein [Bacteroidota bacterium]